MCITHKHALTEENLRVILDKFNSQNLDDLLTIAIIFMGFHTLMHLGELTVPNNESKWSLLKTILQHTIILTPTTYMFMLPLHKADWFFEGNTVMVEWHASSLSPHWPFTTYLEARDTWFPLYPHLWLTSTGSPLSHSWVMQQLKDTLGQDVTTHYLQSRGATALEIAGTPDNHIQA